MILLDALFINNGGGKILLDYLIARIEESNLEVHYLLDERIKDKIKIIPSEKVTYLKGSFFKRHLFYLNNKLRFKKVLCFGNLPPNIKLNAKVFTYFHQPMYLDIPKEFSLKEQLKFNFKIIILKLITNNTNFWMVQTDLIKKKLSNKFDLKLDAIKVLPFYIEFEKLESNDIVREPNTFFYVSNATPHKNHKKLIEVFCSFYDRYKVGKLILTVSKDYYDVYQLIHKKIDQGYPLENIGFVDRLTLQKKYLASEFLVFPSLTESFGLGLIEGIECGCKVIGADLPYTYEICEPSLKFNPFDDESMYRSFEKSLDKEKVRPSYPKIQNNINQVISLLE